MKFKNDQKKAYAYGLNLDHLRDQNHFKNQAILEINAKQRESIIHITYKCCQVVYHLIIPQAIKKSKTIQLSGTKTLLHFSNSTNWTI